MILSFLFSYWLSHRLTQDGSRAQQMALHTLKMMANGGIRDHIGQVRRLDAPWREQQEAVGSGQRLGSASRPMSRVFRASTATPRTASGTCPTLRRCCMTRGSSQWPIHRPSR